MEVTFTRTGPRRYAIRAKRDGHPSAVMDPAPGFDELLPHDLVHFVVEDELGLEAGVFGQLAVGGSSGTFLLVDDGPPDRSAARARRRHSARGDRLSRAGARETAFSERAASLVEHAWRLRSRDPRQTAEARALGPYVERLQKELTPEEAALLSAEVVARVLQRLDELSARWAALQPGQGLSLAWRAGAPRRGRRTGRRKPA